MKNELSLILPTLNEYKNLKFLIPQIVNMLLKNKFKHYEILVVDDGSTDNTEQLIREFNQHNPKIKFITRESKPSLPLSIWSGVEQSNFENVMWLDADGSMHVLAIEKLINIYFEKNEPVIGSRFVDGGGYKGVKDLDNQSFLKAIINVGKSEDSVLGMVASMVFNKFLNLIFKSEIKDLTSGFIILQKKMLNKKTIETNSERKSENENFEGKDITPK